MGDTRDRAAAASASTPPGERSGDSAEMMQGWQTGPRRPHLMEGEVHIWRAELDREPEVIAHYRRMLSTDERRRVDALWVPRDAGRASVARGVLRTLLARYLGGAPEAVRLSARPRGKPVLVRASGQADLRFNLAHAQGLALYAFSLGREVGIDLEYVRDAVDATLIARSFFAPAEVRALGELPIERQPRAFFACWTRKEAYLKARGAGLSLPLSSFTVPVDPDAPPALLSQQGGDQAPSRWFFRDLHPGGEAIAALVVEGAPVSVCCWRYDDGDGLPVM